MTDGGMRIEVHVLTGRDIRRDLDAATYDRSQPKRGLGPDDGARVYQSNRLEASIPIGTGDAGPDPRVTDTNDK